MYFNQSYTCCYIMPFSDSLGIFVIGGPKNVLKYDNAIQNFRKFAILFVWINIKPQKRQAGVHKSTMVKDSKCSWNSLLSYRRINLKFLTFGASSPHSIFNTTITHLRYIKSYNMTYLYVIMNKKKVSTDKLRCQKLHIEVGSTLLM